MNLRDALLGMGKPLFAPSQYTLVQVLQGMRKQKTNPIPASQYYANFPTRLPTMNLDGSYNGLENGPTIFSQGGPSYYDPVGQLGKHNQRWTYPTLQYNLNSIPQKLPLL